MSDRFLGNHTHTDYFKLLRQDGDSLVIGARNVIYNISIEGLVENREQVRNREREEDRKRDENGLLGEERGGPTTWQGRCARARDSRRVVLLSRPLCGRRFGRTSRHARLVGRNSGRGRNSGNWCQKVELICPDKQRSLPSVCVFRMDEWLGCLL